MDFLNQDNETRVCRTCGYFGNIKNFHSDKGYKCKECHRRDCREYQKINTGSVQSARRAKRAGKLEAQYGFTDLQYETMLIKQNYVCAVCLASPRSGKKLSVDHDHDSGEIRGLLCHGCNVAIGFARDDPRRLRLLAQYLDKQGGRDDYFTDTYDKMQENIWDTMTREAYGYATKNIKRG